MAARSSCKKMVTSATSAKTSSTVNVHLSLQRTVTNPAPSFPSADRQSRDKSVVSWAPQRKLTATSHPRDAYCGSERSALNTQLTV